MKHYRYIDKRLFWDFLDLFKARNKEKSLLISLLMNKNYSQRTLRAEVRKLMELVWIEAQKSPYRAKMENIF